MDEELARMSTEELVDFVTSHPHELSSISIGIILQETVQRALHVLQGQKQTLSEQEEVQPELAALYGDCCYTWLINLLGSTLISVRALAGATYLLALLTAGESNYAEDFRRKVVKGCGVFRLVALLSAQSVSVRFNALLALGNLLRHCPNVHSEFLRLGALRKLSVLFNQACEEPQKNACVDGFLCLCNSETSGMCEELSTAGFVAQLLQWISGETSTRVAIKAVESISALLDKGLARSHILKLNLVQPLLSLLEVSESKELNMAVLTLLECVCCSEDGMSQRVYFVDNDGVRILTQMIQLNENRELLLQVVRMFGVLVVLDMRVRQEIIGMDSCLQYLQGLLCSHSEARRDANQKKGGTCELFPLLDEHVASIQLLCKVCHNNSSLGKGSLLCARSAVSSSGRLAARVGGT
eukprot:c27959_g2_i1 orf=372-1607(+)